jgi:hypothetical protein
MEKHVSKIVRLQNLWRNHPAGATNAIVGCSGPLLRAGNALKRWCVAWSRVQVPVKSIFTLVPALVSALTSTFRPHALQSDGIQAYYKRM